MLEFILLAMVLNAYAMSWFDFQNKCRQLGQQMPLATHHKKLYWTKYYKRQSDWIGKYGKYSNVHTMAGFIKKNNVCNIIENSTGIKYCI